MAVKDHSLDDKIIRAATGDFMEHGYRKASLHKIAERAGITTGALYTRYRNKDALFCSLVHSALSSIRPHLRSVGDAYEKAGASRDGETLLGAIRQEEKIYLDLLFEHYDACVLFFCRSDGSSVEEELHQLMEFKAAETVRFLKKLEKQDTLDLDGVSFIMAEQFHFYREILQRGYTKEKAISCMETVDTFLEAGWKALFEKIL